MVLWFDSRTVVLTDIHALICKFWWSELSYSGCQCIHDQTKSSFSPLLCWIESPRIGVEAFPDQNCRILSGNSFSKVIFKALYQGRFCWRRDSTGCNQSNIHWAEDREDQLKGHWESTESRTLQNKNKGTKFWLSSQAANFSTLSSNTYIGKIYVSLRNTRNTKST